MLFPSILFESLGGWVSILSLNSNRNGFRFVYLQIEKVMMRIVYFWFSKRIFSQCKKKNEGKSSSEIHAARNKLWIFLQYQRSRNICVCSHSWCNGRFHIWISFRYFYSLRWFVFYCFSFCFLLRTHQCSMFNKTNGNFLDMRWPPKKSHHKKWIVKDIFSFRNARSNHNRNILHFEQRRSERKAKTAAGDWVSVYVCVCGFRFI